MLVGKLISLISHLPQAIHDAEQEVVSATRALNEAEEALELYESTLILEGKITGKNDMERKAQLLALTQEERRRVTEARHKLALAKLRYALKANEFKAARSVAQVISQLSDEADNNEPAA